MNNPSVLSSHYGRITYTWHIVNAECTGEASAIYNFRQIPSPEAGPDMTVCGVTAEITGAYPTIPTIEGSSLQWTGAGVTFSPTNTIQPTVNANGSGTYVITLAERNGMCVGTDNMTITFINAPTPTTTDGVDTVCGNVAELQVFNTDLYDEGNWTAYDLNDNVLPTAVYNNYNNPNSPSSDRYPHSYVTVPIPDNANEVKYRFKWTELIYDPRLPDNAPECYNEVEKYVVFKKSPSISVSGCGVSSNNHITAIGNSVELCANLSSEYNAQFSWTSKDIAGSFSNPTNLNTTFTLDNSIVINGSLDANICFVGMNGNCMAIDTMHVTFMNIPETNEVSNAVCGREYTLTSEYHTSTSRWFVESKPNPNAQVTWSSNLHNDEPEIVNVTDYGIYSFALRDVINGVSFTIESVTVEFMEIPNPMAGNDFVVCGLDFQLNAITSHNEGDNIVGTWTNINGGTATFADRTNPNTTGHYSAYGPATFRWTETNHPSIETNSQEICSASDDVVVTFYEPPSAVINMHPDDTVACGLITPFFLRADTPGDGVNGYWYEQNPSTQFGPNNATVNNTITDVTVSSYGRHDFYWIECSGPADNPRMCRDTAGPWTIDFLQVPTAQISESEMTFCGYDGLLHADFNGIGEGRWSTNAHSSILAFDDRSDPNTLIHTTVLNSGNYEDPYFEIYWTVQNTVYCTDRDTVKVVFAAVPSDSIMAIPPKCFGEPAILRAYDTTITIYDWDYGNGIIDSVINNVANGTYLAFVHWEDMQTSHVVGLTTTNAWGCTSNIGSAIVEEPYRPEYTYNIIGDTCGKSTGIIEFIDTTGYFSFFWIDTTAGPSFTDPRGYPITAADNYSVSNLPAGTYTYRSDYQSFNREYITIYYHYFGEIYCHDFPQVVVDPVAGTLDESPVINVFGEFHDCAPSDVMLSVDEYASYMWSNGATNRLIHVTEPGYYNVTVADANGCTAVSNQVQIGGSSTLTTAPQISIVGMNSRNRNVVYWSALSDENVYAYNIYRENNVADVFELAATIPSNAQTYWIDETSQPSSRAYKYKVTAVDACGGESPMSDYHKTMHLTINRGIGTSWNLIWSHYEGFSFGSYRIYRGTSPSDLVMLEEIPSYQNSYTDYNVDNEEGLYYQVEVVRNIGSRTYLSSRSNIVSNDYVSNYTIVTAANNDEYGIVIGGGTYPMNTDITLYAIPNNGYHFSSWNDGNTENPRHVVVTGDATYVASFASNQQGETYTITVLSSNNEQGTVTGSGVYPAGALARISATANNGFVFTSWNDGNTENPRYITVTSDATYIANFADISTVTTYTITVLSANESYGTVVGGGTYAEGTIATIAAIANSGYVFVAWNDGNSENPRQVPVIANATYIASFTIGNGIEENIMPEISIYPNPTSGMLFIKSSEQISHIEFISITGQIMSNVDVNSDNVACDVANFVPGMYFIRIYSGSQNAQTLISVQKFVKE
ncbi:MAG: T9SS type A sorting domain-containing protein [Bacteroidales bacterium]|nr:T9SS type A sorting domain-containing protein [Bacteroidales bacterium]